MAFLRDELVCLLEKHIGAKALRLNDLLVVKVAAVEIGVVPDVGRLTNPAAAMPIHFVEATILRAIGVVVSHMPLAEHAGLVTVVLQHLPDGHLVGPQHGAPHDGVPNARTIRPVTRHQSGPRRRTSRCHVIVAQPDRLVGQLVGVWRLDHRVARATEIAVALVVGNDQHDIGLLGENRDRQKGKEHRYEFLHVLE